MSGEEWNWRLCIEKYFQVYQLEPRGPDQSTLVSLRPLRPLRSSSRTDTLPTLHVFQFAKSQLTLPCPLRVPLQDQIPVHFTSQGFPAGKGLARRALPGGCERGAGELLGPTFSHTVQMCRV